jgi:tRNA threonylcarbamoyl adenosine modification protein (Sua5/YciO/YrdC/YwlC family)
MALAAQPEAAAKVYLVKQREQKPGTVIAANVEQLVELGLKRRYIVPVEQYWPGAVSVIIPCGPELAYLHQGKNGLAVRIPDDAVLLELLKQVGPLLTSSANLTGQPTAVTVGQAEEYFGSTVDFYVDGGDLSDRLPSTILRIVDDAVEVVRPGAVVVDQD